MWNGKKISLIIPAFNEERGIALTLTDFQRDPFDEIIVVDNNSKDNTPTIAKEFNVKVIEETRQGYGAAINRGLKEATGDLIIIIEADSSFVYDDIIRLLPLAIRFDLVLGSRTKQNWQNTEIPFNTFMRTSNILLGKLASVFWRNITLTDVGCTYRVIRRELCEKLLPQLRYWGPESSLEMILKAAALNAKIIEIPVTYRKRVGRSKNTASILKALKNGIKMICVMAICLIFRPKVN